MPYFLNNSESTEEGTNDKTEVYEQFLLEDESPQSAKNPFLNRTFREKYNQIYHDCKYECHNWFDETFRWTKKQQRKLTYKLDFRVTFLASLMFAGLQMDRVNILQAVSDNMLDDLKMTTNNYNTGQTIFYVFFLFAELPSQLISKKLGPDIWIPIQMTLWSIVSICQYKLNSKQSFYACRALLGLFQGGFIPDLILWLSYFYTHAELSIRLAFFWSAFYITNILNFLIAYGILHMAGVRGHHGWQWLFLIEGFFTLVIAISSFFLMVPSAVQTKRKWEPKGWFTEEEEKIIVNKVLRDDPTKGDMNNRQGLNLKMLCDSILDWHLWPIYFIGLFHVLPEGTVTAYMTLLLKQMGFNTFHTNLLCIPYSIIKIINMLLITYISEKAKSIFMVALIQPIWIVPLMGVLRFWKGSLVNQWGTYAVLTLLLGSPYVHIMMVSTCSRNSHGVRNRTVSASMYNMCIQAASIIASNIYRTNDQPYYHRANAALFGIAISVFPAFIATRKFYVYLNQRREKIWNSMSEEDRDNYIKNSTDKGSSRLNFRFAY